MSLDVNRVCVLYVCICTCLCICVILKNVPFFLFQKSENELLFVSEIYGNFSKEQPLEDLESNISLLKELTGVALPGKIQKLCFILNSWISFNSLHLFMMDWLDDCEAELQTLIENVRSKNYSVLLSDTKKLQVCKWITFHRPISFFMITQN